MSGLKELFKQKQLELETLAVRQHGMTTKQHLDASAAANIKIALDRQLRYVDFYNQEEEGIDISD